MLFELLDSESVTRVLRTYMTIAFRAGEPPVFVFAGSRDNLIELTCSYFNTEVPKSDLTGFYGLSVFEVKDYSIVLVGRQDDIDRVLGDDFLLLQAHLVAYPANCPQCQGAILPIAAACGEANWDGICKKCSTAYMVSNGDLFIYDVKTQFFVRVGSKPVPGSVPPGLLGVEIIATWIPSEGRYKATYGGSESAESESPDPPPKTWRQLPPLF